MAQVSITRPASHSGLPSMFPEVQHPLSRLGNPETISVQGESNLSSGGQGSERFASQESSNNGGPLKTSPRRREYISTLENALKEHSRGQMDNWRKLDHWINLKKRWASDPRLVDHDVETIITRPGTQMRLQIDELQYLLHEKLRSGGFYILKQLFQAHDPTGRGHVTREVLLTILTRFLRRYIAARQFYHLLLRLKLNAKSIITFENFYSHFKEQEPKGYPAWMDPVKRLQENKRMSATQVHIQLKAMVRERPLELRDLFIKVDNGRMLPVTFQNVLHQLGIEMEQEEFIKLLKRYDPDDLGIVKAGNLMRALGFQTTGVNRAGWGAVPSALGKSTRFRLPEDQPKSPGRNQTKAGMERKLTLDIENWLKEKFREGFKSMLTDFYYYDQDNSGKVSRDNFLCVLKKYNLRLQDDQLNTFLVRCGLQEDAATINYMEFLHNFQDRSGNGIPHRIITDENHRFNKLRSFGSQSSVTALEAKLMELLHNEFLFLLGSFHKIDKQKRDVISQQAFWTILKNRFGIDMSDEEISYLKNRIPLDAQGNVKYLEFMSIFDSCKGAKSLLCDKSMMTNLSNENSTDKEYGSGRTTDQISNIIQDLVKKQYQMVEQNFNKLDKMNTRRFSPESMYQLLKQFDIHPPITRDDVRKLWSTLITSQDNTLDFYEFVRHFGFSPKSACYPNAKIHPPVKGDSDFLIRSRKFNCDTEIIEDNLQAKVKLLLDDLWTNFREFDQFNTGFVSKEEFKDVLMDVCEALNDQTCEIIANRFTHEKNRVSYLEFLQPFEDRRRAIRLNNLKVPSRKHQPEITMYTESMHKGLNMVTEKLRRKLAGNRKTLERVCRKLDFTSTGFLTLPEFRSVLRLCNIVLDEDEIYHMMSKYDENMEGKIKYSNIINKIFKAP
ncbi:EF-hand calcium-binding domain-containing protein 6-like [Hemiscyllium ocellatum]|uniref:EF-hand calcium-binding domain-containing protein 6-like n=1 Tax=Hemiscyllium ocellatum TaxID=170820 RepID=UPI00296695CD|nr:EF-hand calcium-binding domain-containing protein 6-like [Hemiscyllium ocellatum]